jgi:hypothetical protein
VIVREAKGNKDRVGDVAPFICARVTPANAVSPRIWEADRQAQRGGVEVPHALDIKYPKVGATWGLVLDVSFANAVNRPAHWR